MLMQPMILQKYKMVPIFKNKHPIRFETVWKYKQTISYWFKKDMSIGLVKDKYIFSLRGASKII